MAEKPEKKCGFCEKSFIPIISHNIFCSKKCARNRQQEILKRQAYVRRQEKYLREGRLWLVDGISEEEKRERFTMKQT